MITVSMSDEGPKFANTFCSQSQSIHPAFLPTLSPKIAVKKKADYAWVYSPENVEAKQIYDALSLEGRGISLSQMTDTYQKRVAMFCGVEVKRTGGDDLESRAQLAIFLSAGLRRIETLKLAEMGMDNGQSSPEGPVWSEDIQYNLPQARETRKGSSNTATTLPLLGWTVHGHDWSLYVAWNPDDGSSQTVCTSALTAFTF